MREKILVTGGTGYIGSHTVVELFQSGYDPLVIDNLSNSRIETLDGIEAITGAKPDFCKLDLRNLEELRSYCRDRAGIKAIIHFAALKAVGESVEKPLEYYGNNLISMINILQVMKEFAIPNLVFSSSCTVYGQPDKLPVTEDTPVKPAESPYGNTKQICEEIIRDTVASSPDLRAISLRYFNPVGAHPSARIGELPSGMPLNLVPFLTQTVAGIRDCLRVFGNDYNTPDGTGIRDYIYVVDLAAAHVKAIGRLLQGSQKPYEVFNLGTGRGLSVMEIIRAFERATGEKVNYQICPRRPGDIAVVYADTARANKELEWKSATPIEDVLASAWKWEKFVRKLQG